MPFAPAVVERTMKDQQVLMQAISGQLTWLEAEDILGWRPRTLRRWRLRYQQRGYDGLLDRRRQQPAHFGHREHPDRSMVNAQIGAW